jgi:hypothetical protein
MVPIELIIGGFLTMILSTFQGHVQNCCIFCWQVSAICCGFTSPHRSVFALDSLLLCGRSFELDTAPACQLVSTWGSCVTYCSLFEMTAQQVAQENTV